MKRLSIAIALLILACGTDPTTGPGGELPSFARGGKGSPKQTVTKWIIQPDSVRVDTSATFQFCLIMQTKVGEVYLQTVQRQLPVCMQRLSAYATTHGVPLGTVAQATVDTFKPQWSVTPS